MKDNQRPSVADMVREFHRVCGLAIPDRSAATVALRARLIREEGAEAADAIEEGDLLHTAHELADLVYVTYGAALQLGIDLDRALALMHASNMTKLEDGEPVKREDGKILKGRDYQPPTFESALVVQE